MATDERLWNATPLRKTRLYDRQMPKRTNQFQRLAATIHAKLTKGWVVEESAMLMDRVTGALREVDVVARATVMTYEMLLCIECRDHARAADVTWIEAMAKKHEALGTSKLVLWSRRGFTSSAVNKAAFLGIELISSLGADKTDWAKFARNCIGSKVRLVNPIYSPQIFATDHTENSIKIPEPELAVWYDEAGEVAGAMPAVIQQLQTDEQIRTKILDHAPIGSGDFWVHASPPEGSQWFVLDESGMWMTTELISIGMRTSAEDVFLDTASVHYQEKIITLASGIQSDGRRIDFYVEESENKKPQDLK